MRKMLSLLIWEAGSFIVKAQARGMGLRQIMRRQAKDQAALFLAAGVGASVVIFALLLAYLGCSAAKALPGAAFRYCGLLGTQNRLSFTVTQRPIFSSIMNGNTAFESHLGHLPCTLSVPIRKQSRHSNSSEGWEIGLTQGTAIFPSFRIAAK
jgi:hypothetical protein